MQTIQSILKANSRVNHLELSVLLAHAIKKQRSFLISEPDYQPTNNELKIFTKMLSRQQTGEPIAYIIGEKEFFGRSFLVNKDVLVPRPETEALIELAKANQPKSILDVGTGSGCIAITLACELPDSRITAIDISTAALKVAAHNYNKICPNADLNFLKSDMLEQIRPVANYDLVIANLPYISEQTRPDVGASTKAFEPDLALYSADQGLHHYEQLFDQLVTKTIEFKQLICEIGYDQAEGILALGHKYFGKQGVIHQDLAGLARIYNLKNN